LTRLALRFASLFACPPRRLTSAWLIGAGLATAGLMNSPLGSLGMLFS
jgi:hypothetical protein